MEEKEKGSNGDSQRGVPRKTPLWGHIYPYQLYPGLDVSLFWERNLLFSTPVPQEQAKEHRTGLPKMCHFGVGIISSWRQSGPCGFTRNVYLSFKEFKCGDLSTMSYYFFLLLLLFFFFLFFFLMERAICSDCKNCICLLWTIQTE